MSFLYFCLSLLLLVLRTSSTVMYLYNNPECNNDPIAAEHVNNLLCSDNITSSSSSRIECNETHAYEAVYSESGCTGVMTPTDPMPLNLCRNNSRLVCYDDGSFSGANNYVNTLYNDGNCQGGIEAEYWQRLDVCLPVPAQQSSKKYVMDSSHTLQQISYGNSSNCTGPSSTAPAPMDGSSMSITSTTTYYPGLVGLFNYLDEECHSDALLSGTGRRGGECIFGSIWECVGDVLAISNYANMNCTGGRTNSEYFNAGQCVNGAKAFCPATHGLSDSIYVPVDAYQVATLDPAFGQACAIKFLEFTVPNLCSTVGPSGSQRMSYTSNSSGSDGRRVITQQWSNSTNCTGPKTAEYESFVGTTLYQVSSIYYPSVPSFADSSSFLSSSPSSFSAFLFLFFLFFFLS